MRKIYTLIWVLALPFQLFAQRNFHRFSIGAGAGLTHSMGDVKGSQARKLLSGTADYYLTPFLHGGVEVQIGNMSGLEASNNRYFNNSFKAVIVNAKIHLGQFMNDNDYHSGAVEKLSKGLFIGTGAGIIKNNQTEIYRQAGNQLTNGLNNNKDVFFPFSAGLDNSGFHNRIIAGIRYQYNYALGDQVDGYSRSGSRNDVFSNVTLNLKYRFGKKGVW